MKKTLFLFICLLMLLSLLSACSMLPNASRRSGELSADSSTASSANTYTGAAFMKEEVVLTGSELRAGAQPQDQARVFYEIFVGSFSDSDADGIGDLRGIINRMDYLNDGDPNSGRSLGVEGLWLTPIFKSPTYHKYGVTDYYTIDPKFGTMDDLQDLINICHERDVKLILDLTINHSGNLCDWFSKFVLAHRQGDTESEFYDFYSWCGPDQPGETGHRYQQIVGSEDSYECNFAESMPEFNMDNEFTRQTLLDVAKYYLAMGVDGFRFDAAKYVYYGDNRRSASFMKWYMDELRADYPDMYAVSEVWDGDGITDLYYPATNCFNFTTSQVGGLIASTAKSGAAGSYASYVESYLREIHAINPDGMYIPFIANHDTDRAAGYLTVASGQMKMAANLYILCSGSPFIYYGEELGMRGSRGSANTDANRRLAMVWNDGDTIKNPTGSDYDKQIEQGVAEQIRDENSLYNYYKKLIMIRLANPEIARGEFTAYSVPDSKVGGFFASYEGSTVLVLHNTTLSAATVDLSDLGVSELRAVIGVEDASLDGTTLTIGAQTSVVLK